VLGARAGEPRYVQIQQTANQLAQQPQVQQALQTVQDPEQRQRLARTARRTGTALLSRTRGNG
jgi:hypothetical protein